MDAAVGVVGRIVTRVRAGLPGEVVLTVSGVREHYLAYSPEPLAVGTQVLVVASRGGRALDVERWEAGLTPGSAEGLGTEWTGER